MRRFTTAPWKLAPIGQKYFSFLFLFVKMDTFRKIVAPIRWLFRFWWCHGPPESLPLTKILATPLARGWQIRGSRDNRPRRQNRGVGQNCIFLPYHLTYFQRRSERAEGGIWGSSPLKGTRLFFVFFFYWVTKNSGSNPVSFSVLDGSNLGSPEIWAPGGPFFRKKNILLKWSF